MPFIPHTEDDVQSMLDTLEASSIEQLFDEIPKELHTTACTTIPSALTESELLRLMKAREPQAESGGCFIGAGAYEHHIPAVVSDLIGRGEFYTAYTPYQAEASQGSLQVIYEFQTMITRLMRMEISNASLYDGASALAEAVLMAVRLARGKKHRVLVPKNLHPHYQAVLKTITSRQSIECVPLDFEQETGTITPDTIAQAADANTVAVILSQPNFFGGIEDADTLTAAAHAANLRVIAVVNPTAMALLKPPGDWSEHGADIVCGEGQPLGVPLASGGPYFGFMCCRKKDVRQMPGRIVGRTTDVEGKIGYTLTLQAREQHIRRSKATSNICTNQGLMVVAATIYMSVMGPKGLQRTAAASHQKTQELVKRLTTLPGVESVFKTPFFHETVLRLDRPVKPVLLALSRIGLQGGLDLSPYFPELKNSLLICATETKTTADLVRLQEHLAGILSGVVL